MAFPFAAIVARNALGSSTSTVSPMECILHDVFIEDIGTIFGILTSKIIAKYEVVLQNFI